MHRTKAGCAPDSIQVAQATPDLTRSVRDGVFCLVSSSLRMSYKTDDSRHVRRNRLLPPTIWNIATTTPRVSVSLANGRDEERNCSAFLARFNRNNLRRYARVLIPKPRVPAPAPQRRPPSRRWYAPKPWPESVGPHHLGSEVSFIVAELGGDARLTGASEGRSPEARSLIAICPPERGSVFVNLRHQAGDFSQRY
jgi:hypothetical protein